MFFIYFIHLMCWMYLTYFMYFIYFIYIPDILPLLRITSSHTTTGDAAGGANNIRGRALKRPPPCVVNVVVCNEVNEEDTVHQVDKVDEVHQVDPVHQNTS